MDGSPSFALTDLTKRFGNVTALDGLTVTVPRGSVGLVGANGAGKTTMFRLLLGLIAPTKGRVEVRGQDVQADPIARPQPPRLHARARLPPAGSDRGRPGLDAGRDERASGSRRPAASVRCARPRRARRGEVPPDRGLLDRHAPAHEARPSARRRPRARAARRADRGARPDRPPGDARPRQAPRRVRHLRRARHAPARRRAVGLRSRRDDRRRQARAVRTDRSSCSSVQAPCGWT